MSTRERCHYILHQWYNHTAQPLILYLDRFHEKVEHAYKTGIGQLKKFQQKFAKFGEVIAAAENSRISARDISPLEHHEEGLRSPLKLLLGGVYGEDIAGLLQYILVHKED